MNGKNKITIKEKGIYPEYSEYRKRILLFWKKALKENKINQNDSMKIALKQVYKKIYL